MGTVLLSLFDKDSLQAAVRCQAARGCRSRRLCKFDAGFVACGAAGTQTEKKALFLPFCGWLGFCHCHRKQGSTVGDISHTAKSGRKGLSGMACHGASFFTLCRFLLSVVTVQS